MVPPPIQNGTLLCAVKFAMEMLKLCNTITIVFACDNESLGEENAVIIYMNDLSIRSNVFNIVWLIVLFCQRVLECNFYPPSNP